MADIKHPGRWLSIVGIGEDGRDGLSPAALGVIGAARLVVGGARHLALLGPHRGETLAWPSPLTDAIPAILARRGEPVVVLASGDPFLWGVGATLARHLPAEEIAALPAPSAFSLAAARLGWPLQEVATLSLHGRRIEAIAPHLQPGARILALTSDAAAPAEIAALIAGLGFGPSRMTVLEALGGPREALRHATAGSFALQAIDPLNLLAVEVVAGASARPIPLACGLPDALFEHDGQLTKREIRALTLSALAPLKGEMLWDIGLGAGSVAIEWLLADPANRAIGVEERLDRAVRAAANAASLGVPQLEIVSGRAPAALAGLAAPDAVFLGGGAGDEGVFDVAFAALRPGGRLVANAVSLETEALLAGWFARHGGDLVRLSVERVKTIGSMHGWQPAMPVTQWRVTKR